jgi:thiol-disulfide isomerase/thioredoxin
MKVNKHFYLVVVMVLSFSAFSCSKEKTKEASSSNSQMQEQVSTSQNNKMKAPDFTLTSTSGKKINLSDFKGKIVILDFWATWCGPCRRGVPDLVDIQKEFKNKVVVIGISLDDQRTINDIMPFMKQYGINYPIVYGTNKVVMDYGNIQAIPTSFVIDRNGFIVDQNIGLVPKAKFVDRINSLIKGS